MVKKQPANAGDLRDAVQSLGWEDPLEEGMATHSSIFAWKIPWTRSLMIYHSCGHKDLDMTDVFIPGGKGSSFSETNSRAERRRELEG